MTCRLRRGVGGDGGRLGGGLLGDAWLVGGSRRRAILRGVNKGGKEDDEEGEMIRGGKRG